jgi:uncharacterized protein YfaS (alpha-2-macroglobulin family)
MQFLALLLTAISAEAYTLDFHPKGFVKAPRQARAVFSEAMVPFGDPRLMDPFEVKCAAKGKGLWEDARTWIYEFESELTAGVECRFLPKKELKSVKGGLWENPNEFSFSTGGPSVLASSPYDGAQIEEQQSFLFQVDGELDTKSVEKNAYVLVEGMAEKIPVKVLEEKIALQIAKQDYRMRKVKKSFLLAVQVSRPLPSNKRVQLVWGKGIRSLSGSETEKDQFLAFRTRVPFRVSFNCERENPQSPCMPITGMSLNFNAPISRKDAAEIRLRFGKQAIKPDLPKEDTGELSYISFKPPFPQKTQMEITIPKGLKDDAGRSLENADKFPLKTGTGAYPPLAKFAAAFGLLEAADPVLPVTLRNVEEKLKANRFEGGRVKMRNPTEVIRWLAAVTNRHDNYFRWDEGQGKDLRSESLLGGQKAISRFELPKPNGKEAFEVVGIPIKEKGFHVVEIESAILGSSLLPSKLPMFVAAGALVTDMAVHAKWGKENSLFWVTSLSTGKPVSGVKVQVLDCSGENLWSGKTSGDGTAYVEGLKLPSSAKSCNSNQEYSNYKSGLYAFAEKGDDFSFVHSSWDNGIEAWRFQVGRDNDDTIAHTVMDRSLFRSGESVHMKHFLREGFLRGIRFKKSEMPKNVVLVHTTGQRYVLPLQFSANGVAESVWKIPQGAKLGNYTIQLVSRDIKGKTNPVESDEDGEQGFVYGRGTYTSGNFRVEEFRLPVMSGAVQWPKGKKVAAKELSADLAIRYLAGGGASGLPVRVRARAEKGYGASVPGFEDFSFSNGGVKLGKKSRNYSYDEEGNPQHEEQRFVSLEEQKLVLDQNGTGRALIKQIPEWDLPMRLLLEAEYKDPNGEIQTISRGTDIYPTKALVGIKPDSWAATKDKVKFQVAVVDLDDKPLDGRKVKVDWVERKNYSHRKRVVGGFYAYENFEETKELGLACKGESDKSGRVYCEGPAPVAGNLILVAELEEEGKKNRAHRELWVLSGEEWWFETSDSDRIDLLPEKKKYEPGETARLQVRMPFRSATVLLSVEREGIAKHYVREIDAKNPIIELPIEKEFAPNIYVSALVVRGRVEDPKATALVDLARPAHKLGIAELQVGWRAHELKVSVETDKNEYKVREKARVKVKVTRALDDKAASEGEVLLVAVDEALLELKPNESWKLLEAMMGRRGLQVETSTAQSQVVGKRHFGLKALPSGGGGGRATTRELFDTLLYWKATLALDKNGEASAEITLNDSLTSFRFVAIASEGAQRFGTGMRSVASNQELMLFSGVSPLARSGDEINPELTVRNASQENLKVKVSGKVEEQEVLKEKNFELSPGASKTVSWKYLVPKGKEKLNYEFQAQAGEAKDSLKIVQAVQAPLRESVLQATLERVEGKLIVPVEVPRGAISGEVGVRLESSLASNLAAVKSYMSLYPFSCLEQKISKTVSLRDKKKWELIMKDLPAYVSSSGLLKYFPECPCASDVLTSYVLSLSQEAGYSIPQDLLPKIIGGLKAFVSGTQQASGFLYPAADLAIRKLAAMDALSRYGSFDASWLSLITIDPELWPVTALIHWMNLLDREQKIPNREKLQSEVEQILRARLEWRGTVVGFKNEMSLWWLMGSGDSDANRLLLSVADKPRWEPEIGRFVRGALARQKRGVWDLTTANAWGVLAMERFSEKHEKEAVSGESTVSLEKEKKELSWAEAKKRQEVFFPWPKAKADLSVEHKGAGKPWALLQAKAAIPLSEPIFKGYRFQRKIIPLEQKQKGKWSVGDLYRVSIEVEAPSDMMWVAVSDPIPAGATILGSGLGRDSAIATAGEKEKGAYWWYSHEERAFEGFRKYYEWVPKGKFQLEYTVRLNAAGKFQLPNTRVEAMYAPEMYGEAPNETISIQP